MTAAVLAEHGSKAAGKFLQEVVWRTYWKGWLEQRPAVWTRFIDDRDDARRHVDAHPDTATALAQAEAGQTGIEGFDHWARELVETGYLHNHARMWFASIWIFTLRLPWSLGADFFLRHLVDADPASNTLSWRWVAGLQTPGKTYLATAENIERYSDGRFHPAGLAQHALALTEPPLPPPASLDQPPRQCPDDPVLLLLTGEDLHPESLVPTAMQVAGCLVALGGSPSSPWPWGRLAQAFLAGAADDASARASRHFGCEAKLVDAIEPSSMIEHARSTGAKAVVTATAPVGPVADALRALDQDLAAAGLPLIFLRRSWDQRFWPHARKGYFNFRKFVPDLLAEEGLVDPAA